MKLHPHARGLGMASESSRKRLVSELRSLGIRDERVLAVMARVPRHEFMEEALRSRAYENNALPIGHAQTISQPYVVALMTEAVLRDGTPKRVLEIGTGSGYQTAVLAELVPAVFTIERRRPLSELARSRLRALGYENVVFSYGDGNDGWAAHAPYEAILVTAAAESVPPALTAQLAAAGRLVIPVGPPGLQALKLVRRRDARIEEQKLGNVTFVPLVAGRE
ncbi:MAG TPA: protein-L-isoaspartate(D-aspartate) O-methyltransferase [Candidatus Binatia bacterium]|nr:protein-L-isoaspartate(D-aspartate) O-methyltransferase [Candidatus Binatia bacterium]